MPVLPVPSVTVPSYNGLPLPSPLLENLQVQGSASVEGNVGVSATISAETLNLVQTLSYITQDQLDQAILASNNQSAFQILIARLKLLTS